jgi:hypothetical protein
MQAAVTDYIIGGSHRLRGEDPLNFDLPWNHQHEAVALQVLPIRSGNMKLTKALLAVIAVLLCVATYANAQTVAMNGIGSSALFLEMGQAAALSPTVGANCTWTVAKGTVSAFDGRSGVGLSEAGQFWVAWQPGTGTCTAPAGSYKIYSYLQTDSTVGDRCVLASPACTLVFPSSTIGTAGASPSLLAPVVDITSLPASIQAALNGLALNVAGTDIRPEDAKFATIRALTDCGKPVNGVVGSQYLGLGYATSSGGHVGNAIKGATLTGGSSFNVVDFNLTGTDPISSNAVSTFTVYDVGAVPIVVFVNPADINGFGNILVQNITRPVLAGYLDGTYGRASDLIGQTYSASSGGSNVATTVFVREPLSGTYNTMEYSVPNNVELQTSQDVGFNSPVSIDPQNCTAGTPSVVSQNPLADGVLRPGGAGTSFRYRAIGTGNEVAAVLANTDSLGYSFWGTGNFKNATATNAKYLTVDGVDPLQQVWTDGLVPTAGNGLLGNVSFANVKNGSYPIWSKLRLAATPTGAAGAATLASGAQSYVSPQQPDFVPVNQLLIVRSHFAPPYNSVANVYSAAFPSSGVNLPANGTSVCNAGSTPEAGGDVGGMVYTLQSDGDFCRDTGSTVGNVGRRQ